MDKPKFQLGQMVRDISGEVGIIRKMEYITSTYYIDNDGNRHYHNDVNRWWYTVQTGMVPMLETFEYNLREV